MRNLKKRKKRILILIMTILKLMKRICLNITWPKNLIHPHILPKELVKLCTQH
ncbi:uncharacterized protein DS421_13g423030 [Arachis hypogaea]|nr:uncharacterized protein DS421_13g423030 [Arachis hypogaea]